MGTEEQTSNGGGVATAAETLTITDNRTGKTYEVPIRTAAIRAMDLRQIKVDDDDFGLMTYDPALHEHRVVPVGDHLHRRRRRASSSTAATRSSSSREQSTYLEVAYLLVHGELPTQAQLDEWIHEITIHTFVHENVKKLHAGLPLRRPPDGDAARLGRRALDLLSGRQRRSRTRRSATSRSIRLIAKMPTLAAFAYRHNMGQPYVYPDNDLPYAGNFLA